MIVVVTGGRNFSDEERVRYVLTLLNTINNIEELYEGGARGVDEFARRWALDHGVGGNSYPAYWERHGKAAGSIRNSEMLKTVSPDLVVAFPGGKGTGHCVRTARSLGLDVLEVEE